MKTITNIIYPAFAAFAVGQHQQKERVMKRRFGPTMVARLVLGGFVSIALSAHGQVPPTPGVVAGGFCTYRTGFLKTNTQAAQRINQYFGAAVGSEIFHVGNLETPTDDPATYAYTWRKTGTVVPVGQGKNTVQVDSGVAALRQAVGSAGNPGAFSMNATNPTDMGTGGILGAQALAEKVNQGFSEVFVTPATGFSGLSFVDMDGVQLNGVPLTPAQAAALNGQATLQVREAADVALGGGPLPYGLSFSQLTSLIDLVNASFESCGPSSFAQSHMYQPYVTSSAFAGRRPSTVSIFASKPTYNTFSGEVVPVAPDADGRLLGCTSASYTTFPPGKIALVERGVCTFYDKVRVANQAGASAVIIFNSAPAAPAVCPTVPTPGANNCEALVGMGAATGLAPLPIPAAFVQRSTGLLLRDGIAVTAFVQQ
jgi:PA domain